MPPDPPLPAALCKARLEAGAERWQRTVRDARTETDRHKDEKEIAADVDEASEDETHSKFDGSEVCRQASVRGKLAWRRATSQLSKRENGM